MPTEKAGSTELLFYFRARLLSHLASRLLDSILILEVVLESLIESEGIIIECILVGCVYTLVVLNNTFGGRGYDSAI